MKSVYSLAQIVDESLAGIRDFGRTRYQEALMFMHRGFRDFQLFHAVSTKQSWEKITPLKTINLPEDYLNFLSVGVQLNGGIFTLSKESHALTPSDPLGLELNVDRGETDAIRKNVYGYASGGSNTEGYFTLDPTHDRIVLKQAFLDIYTGSTRDEVLLTYVSNGICDDIRNSYIPAAAANLLIAYVEYKLVSSMPEKYPANYRADKFMEYQLEQEKFDILALPSIDELYDAIFQTSGQVKR